MAADPSVLLINPHVVDVALFDLWSRPLGLLYLSSILKKNAFNVDLIDALDRWHPRLDKVLDKGYSTGKYISSFHSESSFSRLPRQKLKKYGLPDEIFLSLLKEIANIPCMILMTSGMTYWYRGVIHTAELIKSVFPHIPIILGGTAAVLDSGTYESSPLFERVYSNTNLSDLYGILEDTLSVHLPSKPVERYDYPRPDWSYYAGKGSAAVQSSWGCIHNCSYCASNCLHPGFYQRPPQEVIDELLFLENEGFSDIAFYDDAILVNSEKHFEIILDGLLSGGFTANLHLPNAVHPQFVTRANAKAMKNAGVKTIAVGYDTAEIRGRQQKEYPVKRAFECFHAAGFDPGQLWCYILAGLPGQSTGEIKDSMRAVHEMGARIRLAWFSPIPGTEDFKKVPWGKTPDFYNNSYYSIVSGSIGEEKHIELKQIERELNRRIYA